MIFFRKKCSRTPQIVYAKIQSMSHFFYGYPVSANVNVKNRIKTISTHSRAFFLIDYPKVTSFTKISSKSLIHTILMCLTFPWLTMLSQLQMTFTEFCIAKYHKFQTLQNFQFLFLYDNFLFFQKQFLKIEKRGSMLGFANQFRHRKS